MAIVGSAYVEISVATDKVAGQIRAALRDGMKGIGKDSGNSFGKEFGDSAGKSFADSFSNAVSKTTREMSKQKITFKADFDTSDVRAQAAVAARSIKEKVTLKGDFDGTQASVAARVAAKRMGQNVKFKADFDSKSLFSMISGVGSLARALRSLAIPALLTAGAPYILSLAASLVQAAGAASLLPAALAGAGLAFGAIKLGFSGIGTALSALTKQDTASATNAAATAKQRIASARAIQNAQESLSTALEQQDRTAVQGAQSVGDARQKLADTMQSAAESVASAQDNLANAVESADRQVTAAEEELANAQRDSERAQADLNQARIDAKKAIEDLSDSLRGASLDEEQAQLRLADAQDALAQARAKGVSGRDLQQLDLDARQAAFALDEAKKRSADLQAQSDQAAKDGVDGSAQVVAAQQRVDDANQKVADSETNLAQTREDNAKAVAKAQDELAKAQQQAARDVSDAQVALSRAIVSANQANEDSARSVADAQRSLAQAIQDASDQSSTAANKAAVALSKLSPNALAFVNAIRGAGPAWKSMQLDVQQRLLDGISTRFSTLATNYIPILGSSLGIVADGFNAAFRSSIDFFNTANSTKDMKTALDNVATGVSNAAQGTKWWLQALRDILVVGSEFMPKLGASVADTAQRFADFIAQARQSGKLHDWIQSGIDAFQQMWDVIKNVSSILHSLFGDAQASGETFLSLLDRFTKKWADALKTPKGAADTTEVLKNVRMAVEGLIDKIVSIWPAIAAAGGAFFALSQAAAPVTSVVITLVADALTPLFDLIRFMAPVLGPLIALFFTISTAMRIYGAVTTAVKVATLAYNLAMGAQFVLSKEQLALLGANKAAMVAGTIASYAVRAATIAWTGVQWLLNAALAANPIALVVIGIAALVAAFVLAWQHSATFRDIVIGAWNGIKDAASAVWNGFLKPIFDAFATAIGWVVDNWKIFAAIFLVILGPIGVVIAAFTLFHDQTFAIFGAIGKFFSDTWDWIGSTAVSAWNAISNFFEGLWSGIENFFIGVWNGISGFAVYIWNIISGFFVNAFNIYVGIFQAIWGSIRDFFVSVWDAIKNTAITWWNNIYNFYAGVFASFGKFFSDTWNGIKNAFGDAFGGIEGIAIDIWNRVKKVFTDGLNTIIGGLNWPIDKINGLFNIKIPTIPTVNLATGGDISGRVSGLPGRRADRVPAALSAEEHVWSGQEVDGAGGHFAVRELRQLARSGVLKKLLAGIGLAEGGPVTDSKLPAFTPGAFIVREKVADNATRFLKALNAGQAEALQATGGKMASMPGFADGGALANAINFARGESGKPYIWGGVGPKGYDCSGFMSAITNVLRGQYPYKRLGVAQSQPWPGFRSGLGGAFSTGFSAVHTAGTLAGTNVESGGVHDDVRFGGPAVGADSRQFSGHAWLPDVGGVFTSGGNGGNAPASGSSVFDSVAGWVHDAARNAIASLIPDTPSMFKPMGLSTFDQSWDGMRKKAIDTLSLGIFDWGGWLNPGMSLAMNNTGKPEAVISNPADLIEKLVTSSQQTFLKNSQSGASLTFENGAFNINLGSNVDSVTIDQLKKALQDWGNEILHMYEGSK